MSQYDTLTLQERKEIAIAWVTAGHSQTPPLYICVHIGTTVQRDAMELAAHALSIGADVRVWWTRSASRGAGADWRRRHVGIAPL